MDERATVKNKMDLGRHYGVDLVAVTRPRKGPLVPEHVRGIGEMSVATAFVTWLQGRGGSPR